MATYPGGIFSVPTRNTGDVIAANFFNDPNNEIVAIETDLVNGVQIVLKPLTDLGKDLGAITKRFLNIYSAALRALDVASRVNWLEITDSATGNPILIQTNGTDSTVNLSIGTRGGIQLKFIDVASLVNFLQFAGTATGGDPTLSVQGDATRGLILSLPGSGVLNPRADAVTAMGIAATRWLRGIFSESLQVGLNPAAAGALRLANAVSINFRNAGNSADATAILLDASNNLLFATPGGTQLKFIDVASLVNFFQMTGRATGGAPDLAFTGADATVGGSISTKGGFQIKFTDVASIVNYLTFAAKATGTDPSWTVITGDTNRGLIFVPAGTGRISQTLNTGNTIIMASYAGAGAPAAGTLSAGNYIVGDYYYDTTNDKFYVCKTAGSNSTSAWKLIGPAAAVVAPAITVKKGTGAGNYTTTSNNIYVDVDTANLNYAVNVPTGMKATVTFEGAFSQITLAQSVGIAIADVTTVLKEVALDTAGVLGDQFDFFISTVLVGDGASHTFTPRFKAFAAGSTVAIDNASATRACVMTVRIETAT